jgi:death-on-curing family protein
MHIHFGKNGILIIHRYVVRNLVAVDGLNYAGMIQGSIDRAYTTIEGKELFPHILDKAGSILYSMIRFHPFADGCKRTGLLTAYMYLYYNGYYLRIPQDSAKFLEQIASSKNFDEQNEKAVINWIRKHSERNLATRIFNLVISFFVRLGLDIGAYTNELLEREAIPADIRKQFRDTELEKAIRHDK